MSEIEAEVEAPVETTEAVVETTEAVVETTEAKKEGPEKWGIAHIYSSYKQYNYSHDRSHRW